jgi:hypothetical protein
MTISHAVGLTVGQGVIEGYGVGVGVSMGGQVEYTPMSFACNAWNVGQGAHPPVGGMVPAGHGGVGGGMAVGVGVIDGIGVGEVVGASAGDGDAVTRSSPPACAPRFGIFQARRAPTTTNKAAGSANR